MKATFLIVGFSLTLAVSVLNICLLYGGGWIGFFISGIISAFACILILGYLFIPSGIKWILLSKLAALVVFMSPMIFGEYDRFIPFDPSWLLLPMNLALFAVCIVSIVGIYRNNRSQLVRPSSSNS